MPGIYVHVPFCDGKCPYCDFYSLAGSEELMDRYVEAVGRELSRWDRGLRADTVYFGGGTPSLLGVRRLAALLGQIERRFDLAAAEITLEANPSRVDKGFFQAVRQAGFNRLSMGLQSANADELRLLGRKHTAEDAKRAVEDARAAGFDNISLDLMLGLPGGSDEKLRRSVTFAAELGAEHISAYILKVEPGTAFARRGVKVPEDDAVADQYLLCVKELQSRGYGQYEISNFSKPGRESRHNLVYWHGEEYLGFGPGAHSFFEGKRFYYPRDLAGFLAGKGTEDDGAGGGLREFAMLNLRLTEGLQRERCKERFGGAGEDFFEAVLKNAKKCPPELLQADSERIYFTPEGFLVSNALIVRLLPF